MVVAVLVLVLVPEYQKYQEYQKYRKYQHTRAAHFFHDSKRESSASVANANAGV